MNNYLNILFVLLLISSCSTPKSSSVEPIVKNTKNTIYPTQKIAVDGLDVEFLFMGHDDSEKSLKFKSKVKNTSTVGKTFFLNSVFLQIEHRDSSGTKHALKVPARDVALVNKQLYEQITTLESNQSKNAESLGMLVSNLSSDKERKAQKTNDEEELKSMKQRLESLKQKSFYSAKLIPGDVVGGFVYFPLEDENILKMHNIQFSVIVKNVKSQVIDLK